jgi:diguanylate cyclase (GGDEF)-like protein/PAS domain S-box-containing protein
VIDAQARLFPHGTRSKWPKVGGIVPMQPQSSLDRRNTESTGALLVDMVDHLEAMIAYWDGDQICRFVNQAYRVWFGRGRDELLGISLKELLGPLYEMNLPHIEAAYRGERQVFERGIPRPDGSGIRHSLATYLPRIVDGEVIGIFVHVADVEPLKELELELKAARDEAVKLATHDFLTGLPNRMLLMDRFDEMIGRAARTREGAYFMGLDVDRFKQVNDVYGHPAGDQFLIEIAKRIQACVRDYDTVARIGGDEFAVLVSGKSLEDGIESLAARILQSVRMPYSVGHVVLTPGLSIGIAEFPRHGRTREALLQAADYALYEAKIAGRDCFRMANDDTRPGGTVPASTEL